MSFSQRPSNVLASTMALKEEHVRAFIVVTEENVKLKVCNDDSALKQVSKLEKCFTGIVVSLACQVYSCFWRYAKD